jgi:hypothetical protein
MEIDAPSSGADGLRNAVNPYYEICTTVKRLIVGCVIIEQSDQQSIMFSHIYISTFYQLQSFQVRDCPWHPTTLMMNFVASVAPS